MNRGTMYAIGAYLIWGSFNLRSQMTPGKAGGISGERLKGASNTVSRLKAADFFSFPLDGGRLGWG